MFSFSAYKCCEEYILKRLFDSLTDKIRNFMYGRYGADELSQLMSGVSLVLLLLSFVRELRLLIYPALLLTVLSTMRSFSKNTGKRYREREVYLKARNAVLKRFKLMGSEFRDRKTHRYFTCPYCGATMRIVNPGKKRLITIHCAKCGRSFDKET